MSRPKRVTHGIRGTWGTIEAPLSYGDVADVVDPLLGPSEIPPCPAADPTGTVYAVGEDRERWTRVQGGVHTFAVRDAQGRDYIGRPANEALLSRGARILYLAEGWMPPMSRAHIGAPLVRVEGQASLFGPHPVTRHR